MTTPDQPFESPHRKVKNRSAKGRRNEHKSRDWLEAQGYFVVRAAGSKGDWDLVALHPGPERPVMLVQVKSNKVPKKLTAEQQKAYSPFWVLQFHVWKDYARQPLVIDARGTE